MRFRVLASKMQPPCGKNAKRDIIVTAGPISKVLFCCSELSNCFLIKNKRMYFENMGHTLT